jgi:hypothetical protein
MTRRFDAKFSNQYVRRGPFLSKEEENISPPDGWANNPYHPTRGG